MKDFLENIMFGVILTCIIMLFVGVGMCSLGFENDVILLIGLILICVSIGLLIIFGLASAEGIVGLFCGIAIACSCIAFMLFFLIGKVSFLPYSDTLYNTLLWIALPLMLCGGGTAAIRYIIIII